MASDLGTGSDSPRQLASTRALHTWLVGVAVFVILVISGLLAWTGAIPDASDTSRTISDVEIENDVAISPVTGSIDFRPVLRRVDSATSTRQVEALSVPRSTSHSRRVATPRSRRIGNATTHPPGHGGGASAPGNSGDHRHGDVPVKHADTAVAVVHLPPHAVGPVSTPGVAIGLAVHH